MCLLQSSMNLKTENPEYSVDGIVPKMLYIIGGYVFLTCEFTHKRGPNQKSLSNN